MSGLTAEQVAMIERELRCVLPEDVRMKYADSDGFLGPTDCRLLYPLNGEYGVLSANKTLKAEAWYPDEHRAFAILGDDGVGNLICFDSAAREAVLWNPADGVRIQEKWSTVSEAWDYVFKAYENDA
jgi:hypothetical protein